MTGVGGRRVCHTEGAVCTEIGGRGEPGWSKVRDKEKYLSHHHRGTANSHLALTGQAQ